MSEEKKTPEGYMENAVGHLVPVESVSPLDKLEDELVRTLSADAEKLAKEIEAFREKVLSSARDFVALADQEYQVKKGGVRHVSAKSYDGRKRMTVENVDLLDLDTVQASMARKLFDECLADWSKESRAEMVAMVNSAFAKGKNGELSASRVWPLMRVTSDDKRWMRAIDILKAAARPRVSRDYVRFYVRENGKDRLVFRC